MATPVSRSICIPWLAFACTCICELGITSIYLQLLGMCLLGVGIYVQVDTTFGELGFDDYLTSPSIVLMVVGSILFLLGFLGCFGALFELLPILIIVSPLIHINVQC